MDRLGRRPRAAYLRLLADRPLVSCPTDGNGSPTLWLLMGLAPVLGALGWAATGEGACLTLALQLGWVWPRLWQMWMLRRRPKWERCGCGYCINKHRPWPWSLPDDDELGRLRATLVLRHSPRGPAGAGAGGSYVVTLRCTERDCELGPPGASGRSGWQHTVVHLLGEGPSVYTAAEHGWISRECGAWVHDQVGPMSGPAAQLTVALAASLPLDQAALAARASTA